MFNRYPHFKARGARALREILGWEDGERDQVDIRPAEDGSGVGAALIAALTIKRVGEGNLAGIKNLEGMSVDGGGVGGGGGGKGGDVNMSG